MIREIVLSGVEAIRHLERVHGRKVTQYHFTTNGRGDPRLYCNLLDSGWMNPVMYHNALGRLFFPHGESILSADVSFDGVVRIIYRDLEEQ